MMAKIKLVELPSSEFKPVPMATSSRVSRRRLIVGSGLITAAVSTGVVQYWDEVFLKRFAEVVPGQVYRAAWQRPWPIRRLVENYNIRSILSLSVMGVTDEKYTSYAEVVKSEPIDWVIMPVVGSYMTFAQMAEAADWIEQLPKPLHLLLMRR